MGTCKGRYSVEMHKVPKFSVAISCMVTNDCSMASCFCLKVEKKREEWKEERAINNFNKMFYGLLLKTCNYFL